MINNKYKIAFLIRRSVFLNKTIRQGSRGPYVEYLQSILNKLGLGAGTVNGFFGIRTEQAVIRFQRNMGLVPDGIVGPITWQALDPYLKGYILYTIKEGDTFYNLSRQFNTSINALIAANTSANPNNLSVGQELVIPFIRSAVPTDVSYCSEILQFNIASLKIRFPFLEIGSAGKSVLGNNLTYIKFGIGQKEVFYNAAHHANEWITSVVLMKYIEQLSNAYV
ncbi:MAG: peptidase, partial [Clostridia bacterium]|nr:peptidase [Clostridia bacterium]